MATIKKGIDINVPSLIDTANAKTDVSYVQDPNNANASIPSTQVESKPLSSVLPDTGESFMDKVNKITGTGTTETSGATDNTGALTDEQRKAGLTAIAEELAKRSGIDINKLTNNDVTSDSSSITDKEQLDKDEEAKKIKEESDKQDAELARLAKQKEINDYKTAIGIPEDTTKTPDSVADYTALRTQYGVDGLTSQLSDVDAQITDLTSSYKSTSSGLEGQGRGIISGLITGQQAKLEEQYQNALQTLEMKKANIQTQISNATSVISTIMGLKQTDYTNAKTDYNTQFSQQLQLANALKSEADDAKKDANANLNIVLNSVSGTSWDDMDASTQVSLQKLALQSGMDEEVLKALVNSPSISEVLTTSEGYDADGNEIKTIIYKDANGRAGVIETVATGGVKQTSSEQKRFITPEYLGGEVVDATKSNYVEGYANFGLDTSTLAKAAKALGYGRIFASGATEANDLTSEYYLSFVEPMREAGYSDAKISDKLNTLFTNAAEFYKEEGRSYTQEELEIELDKLK